ncbi:putative ferric-chelate reductase 1 [Rhinichthys klamathensis goyatoka]|uniref:putative ferric-chelate reductase 1 n=1 Tax=Rhinichthys klamathensis goyatoka TaxID=3034132 RepID=UPI0024B57AD3|nr:putative ferric-chelate reductase 1 [Rhinichthys klamathensis goyatoka]
MESKRMFLVVCVIGCAVSFIKAESNLSTPTTLTTQITRNECGKTKLCLDNPKGCDPSASSQCFFTSAILTNISLTVELSGNSTGYIASAAGLTSNIPQDRNVIFVCGNNNGGFFFQTTMLYNNTLWITNIPNVNNIQGLIQSSLIQCVFTIPIDGNVTSFLSGGNGTNFNISNIANSQILMFLDILKGSNNALWSM